MQLDNLIYEIENNIAVSIYFSGQDCGVCEVLRPKIKELLGDSFPKIDYYNINANDNKKIAANFSVFSVPTLLIFFDGKEFIRKSRNISLPILKNEISRPYEMLFGGNN